MMPEIILETLIKKPHNHLIMNPIMTPIITIMMNKMRP